MIPTIGFLDAFEDATIAKAKEGFLAALDKNGFSEKRGTLKLIYRNAQGDLPTLIQACDFMIAQQVALIATCPTLSTVTALQRTSKIPVCMMVSPDAEQMSVLDKQGKSPTNLFGVYEDQEYIGTSIRLITETLPQVKRLGLIYNQAEVQSVRIFERVKAECKLMNLSWEALPVNNSSETALVMQNLLSKGVDVFFAMPDNVVFSSFEVILKMCQQARVPVFTSEEGLVNRGAVGAFGADMYQWGYQAGEQAALFLKKNNPNLLKPEIVKNRKKVFNEQALKDLKNNHPIVKSTGSNWFEFFLSALVLGLAFSALALGIFISMRIFDIPDITTDGSYTLGGAVTAVALSQYLPIPLALLAALAAGALAGICTGVIHTKLKVNALLSGILVMTSLYSCNLVIMGKSNLPLMNVPNLFQIPLVHYIGLFWTELWVLAIFTGLVWLGMGYVLRTDFGLAMRATGNSPTMIAANGVNTDGMRITGLAISNALVALSGFLVVQYQRFADINMGIGIVIVGLGSVIIGEALGKALGWTKIQWRLLAIVLGTIVFREILAITLALGIDPNWLKLITALFVLAVVAMPALKQRG